MGNDLFVLPTTDPEYIKIKEYFERSWKHPGKTATVKKICFLFPDHVEKLANRGSLYWMNTLCLFHGTSRACHIGERSMQLCNKPECSTCRILRESFKLTYANPHGMFGPGIYSTEVSSKADNYAKNHRIHSKQHAIIICHVECNRPQNLYAADHSRKGPDSGYNSVKAVTKAGGGSVEYSETVVYQEKAIYPIGIIMYTRTGWTTA